MMSNGLRSTFAMGACLGALLVAGHANAGTRDPDYYVIDITDSSVQNLATSSVWTEPTGTVEGDLASDGSFAYNASAFTNSGTTITGLSATYVVGASGTSGVIDPATGEVSLTLRMKLKFSGSATGGPVGSSCQTAFFTITTSTTKGSSVYTGVSMSTSTGIFRAVAEDFTIPQVTSTNCVNTTNANLINSTFSLGASPGGHAIFFQGSITNPQVPQP
jgi:hypothetical protein